MTTAWRYLLLIGALFAKPVYLLATTLWQQPQSSHGPIVLCIAIWLLWRSINNHQGLSIDSPGVAGTDILIIALASLMYVIGASQLLYALLFCSLPLFVYTSLRTTLGTRFVKQNWFAIAFLVFLIPLPGSVIDTITMPLKVLVSVGAEHALSALGYPIARTGVILYIGPYQLLVADACAGLNSLFTLEALGLIYLNLTKNASVIRSVILGLLIVPISFASNLIRVVLLCLVTYHFGDEVGQGYVHDLSGMILFITALALTVAADVLIRQVLRRL